MPRRLKKKGKKDKQLIGFILEGKWTLVMAGSKQET